MPLEALGPQSSQQEESASVVDNGEMQEDKDESTLVKEAIDRATTMCNENEPLMTQLCRISAEVSKAEKKAKAKRKDEGDEQRKLKKTREGQTRDPRDPHEVLIQEGIEPHPGPTCANKGKRGVQRNGHAWVTRILAGLLYALIVPAESATEQNCQRTPSLRPCDGPLVAREQEANPRADKRPKKIRKGQHHGNPLPASRDVPLVVQEREGAPETCKKNNARRWKSKHKKRGSRSKEDLKLRNKKRKGCSKEDLKLRNKKRRGGSKEDLKLRNRAWAAKSRSKEDLKLRNKEKRGCSKEDLKLRNHAWAAETIRKGQHHDNPLLASRDVPLVVQGREGAPKTCKKNSARRWNGKQKKRKSRSKEDLKPRSHAWTALAIVAAIAVVIRSLPST